MFLLAVSNGLENDAKAAIVKSIEQITKIQAKNGLKENVKVSIAYSNGETSYSLKISTIGNGHRYTIISYKNIIRNS